MDYGIYAPFYEKLTEKIPSLCAPDEVFQLVLPPRGAGWDDIRDGRMYDFIDSVTFLDSCYFAESDIRFSSVYLSYLRYLAAYKPDGYSDAIDKCLGCFETDCAETFYKNDLTQLRPRLQLSGDLKSDIAIWESKDKNPDFKESFLHLQANAKYAYEIHIGGLGCYEIQRGTWYNEQLLLLSGASINGFFDSLRLIPARILVMYGFTVNMRVQILLKTGDRKEKPFVPSEHATSILGVSSKIINPNSRR